MRLREVPLRDMAVREVKSVAPDDSVRKARSLMDALSVDQLPVLDKDGRLTSVITRRRLWLGERTWGQTLVSEVDWEPADGRLIPADTPLGDVFDKLFEEDFVFVTDDGQTVSGIVTINDVARSLYDQLTAKA